jgi:3-oxoacyl-[acyl-carrier protein] reductase
MDLGIAGRSAIVCASSRGLGRACAEALLREGVHVVISGRTKASLDKTAEELRAIGGADVFAVNKDITTQEGQDALLAACPNPDILINSANGPEPKAFANVRPDEWLGALASNMIAPLLLTQRVLPGMIERKFGRIINITSAMVTTPRPHMTLSAGPRAGLTAAMKAISLDVAQHNITINNLLPERFDTDRQHYMAEQTAKRDNISYEEARRRQVQSLAVKRLGDPREFGAMCAFLCSSLAGFTSGQNFHLDGGSYPALV